VARMVLGRPVIQADERLLLKTNAAGTVNSNRCEPDSHRRLPSSEVFTVRRTSIPLVTNPSLRSKSSAIVCSQLTLGDNV